MDTINQGLQVHWTVSDNTVLLYSTYAKKHFYGIVILVIHFRLATYFISKDDYEAKIS